MGYWESITVSPTQSITIPWGKWSWIQSIDDIINMFPKIVIHVAPDCYIGAQDPKKNNKIKIIKIKYKLKKHEMKNEDYFENIDMSFYSKTLDIKKQHWGKELMNFFSIKKNKND